MAGRYSITKDLIVRVGALVAFLGVLTAGVLVGYKWIGVTWFLLGVGTATLEIVRVRRLFSHH
jgi:hypothetical protein